MTQADAILERMKRDGYRLTKVRKAMVEAFSDEGCLLSPADIKARISASRIHADRTTVYRELCFLTENDIIRKTRLANGAAYYELASNHHHHLICTKCSGVQKVVMGRHLEEQEKRIYKDENFKVVSHSLEFYGLCRHCL
ncbi:MAG: transcriptional repressor [Candidatus Moranbacteria bacterium]|nr:transcriptional repressor [Candidatus Moranbacteria bacterium]